MKTGDIWVWLYAGMTRAEDAAITELRWKDHMQARFGERAAGVIARAEELSLTTAMPRGEARAQAEFDEYAAEIRRFSADSVSDMSSPDAESRIDRAQDA